MKSVAMARHLRSSTFRAYEVWGSPEMLNKEKAKRSKNRQQEYEGNDYRGKFILLLNERILPLALFSLKKSVKEYQKRLSLLENASFDNRKSVIDLLASSDP